MKTKFFASVLIAGFAASLNAAEPLTRGTFTDVVKDVSVVAATTKAATPAAVNAVVTAPDLVRTGPASRAELTAPDHTITRVGANTVFSFAPDGRTVNLEQGSVLFHSPKGKGGGTIKSGGASAAVLGSTLMGVASADGSFKTIFLEGKECKVTLKNGKSVTLHAGQMVVVLPGGEDFGPVLDIDLAKLVETSLLVIGFDHPLDSLPLIELAIQEQQRGGGAGNQPPGGGMDNNTFSTLTVPNSPPRGQGQTPPPIGDFPPPQLPTFPGNQPPST
ncbi:MAG: FecR family protein, partial [Verrucomicrobia bacterium]|nr:FecR family protein [Verrucomicrobiota bacterium]